MQRERHDESEPADVADGADSEQGQGIHQSRPYLGEMFEDVGSEDDSWGMRCLVPAVKVLVVLQS